MEKIAMSDTDGTILTLVKFDNRHFYLTVINDERATISLTYSDLRELIKNLTKALKNG